MVVALALDALLLVHPINAFSRLAVSFHASLDELRNLVYFILYVILVSYSFHWLCLVGLPFLNQFVQQQVILLINVTDIVECEFISQIKGTR